MDPEGFEPPPLYVRQACFRLHHGPNTQEKGPTPKGGLATSYAIAIDPSGKLRWTKSDIDGEHVVTILTQSVSDDYLAFLQAQGVSYLFGGKSRIDLESVLRRLRSKLGIEKLLLEGGGKINGTFLDANLIDELSILVAPVADGSIGTASLFDVENRRMPARGLKLLAVEQRSGGIVWLRYKVR